jgi:hypothetical protein
MAPVRNYSNWNKRLSDEQTQINPYKNFLKIKDSVCTQKRSQPGIYSAYF